MTRPYVIHLPGINVERLLPAQCSIAISGAPLGWPSEAMAGSPGWATKCPSRDTASWLSRPQSISRGQHEMGHHPGEEIRQGWLFR